MGGRVRGATQKMNFNEFHGSFFFVKEVFPQNCRFSSVEGNEANFSSTIGVSSPSRTNIAGCVHLFGPLSVCRFICLPAWRRCLSLWFPLRFGGSGFFFRLFRLFRPQSSVCLLLVVVTGGVRAFGHCHQFLSILFFISFRTCLLVCLLVSVLPWCLPFACFQLAGSQVFWFSICLPNLSLCLSPCCWFGWADVGEFGSYVHPNCLSLYYHLRIVALLLSSLNVMFWHRRWIQCTWKVKEENRRSSVGESDFTVRME